MGARDEGSDEGARSARELIPREYLRVIAVWSIIPSYLVAGGFVGWLLDAWLGRFPLFTGILLVGSLVLATRDVMRLRDMM